MFEAAEATEKRRRNNLKQIYIVTEIQNDETVIVSPEIHFEHNKKNRPNIVVSNPRKLKIEKGSKVTIGLPQKKEAAAGIFALLAPIACAAAGLIFSSQAADFLKTECTEIFKAFCASACFLTACIFIFASSRTAPTIAKLEINKIVQS